MGMRMRKIRWSLMKEKHFSLFYICCSRYARTCQHHVACNLRVIQFSILRSGKADGVQIREVTEVA